MPAGGNVGLGNDNRIRRDLRLQWHRIAASGHSHRLRVNGSGTVLADYSMRTFVESNAAADFARVEQGSNFSIGLLIEPEAYFDATFLSFKAMQFAIINLASAGSTPVRQQSLLP